MPTMKDVTDFLGAVLPFVATMTPIIIKVLNDRKRRRPGAVKPPGRPWLQTLGLSVAAGLIVYLAIHLFSTNSRRVQIKAPQIIQLTAWLDKFEVKRVGEPIPNAAFTHRAALYVMTDHGELELQSDIESQATSLDLVDKPFNWKPVQYSGTWTVPDLSSIRVVLMVDVRSGDQFGNQPASGQFVVVEPELTQARSPTGLSKRVSVSIGSHYEATYFWRFRVAP